MGTFTPYTDPCGEVVNILHLDGNPNGPMASSILYDANWNNVSRGAC